MVETLLTHLLIDGLSFNSGLTYILELYWWKWLSSSWKKKAFPSKKVVGNLACKKNFLFDDRYVFLGVLLKYSFVSPNDERESVKMRSE